LVLYYGFLCALCGSKALILMTDDLTPKAVQTRLHILDTALELFATQGYDATTMREIAAAADCSLGLAYRYFASKEEMVLALYGRMALDTR
jgi:AcrR family transcriptional regulator